MTRNVPKKKWEDWEIEKVKEGDVPDGRTYLQAASYAYVHGIPWKKLRASVCKWWWKPEEEEILKKGEVPPNRSWHAIRLHKKKLGIPNDARPIREDYLIARRMNG